MEPLVSTEGAELFLGVLGIARKSVSSYQTDVRANPSKFGSPCSYTGLRLPAVRTDNLIYQIINMSSHPQYLRTEMTVSNCSKLSLPIQWIPICRISSQLNRSFHQFPRSLLLPLRTNPNRVWNRMQNSNSTQSKKRSPTSALDL